MILVHTSGSIDIAEELPTPTLDLAYANTLEGGRIVGDGRAMPTTLRIPAVAYAGGIEAVHQFLISLGVALRNAVRLEWAIPGLGTYRRALRPGGRLRIRTARGGVIRYELELLPGSPTWVDDAGNPVLLWH